MSLRKGSLPCCHLSPGTWTPRSWEELGGRGVAWSPGQEGNWGGGRGRRTGGGAGSIPKRWKRMTGTQLRGRWKVDVIFGYGGGARGAGVGRGHLRRYLHLPLMMMGTWGPDPMWGLMWGLPGGPSGSGSGYTERLPQKALGWMDVQSQTHSAGPVSDLILCNQFTSSEESCKDSGNSIYLATR